MVTGGAKRIGKAVALALAGRGYDIALHCRSSEADAEALARTVQRSGRACEVFSCDLEDPVALSGLVPAVRFVFPHCRLLVNNASVFERGAFWDVTPRLYDRLWAVNFRAPFFLTQAFAAEFKQGQVVNLCDTKAAKEFTSHFAYTLTKKALVDFTRMAAKALGPRIRVNAVAPGMILPSAEFGVADLDRLSKKIPLQRKGTVRDVVAAVLFLENNAYVTGECVFVDGGEHLR